MADISALFGMLLLIAVAFPGMLTALWLLVPATVERARLRLEHTPGRCFWLGGVLLAVLLIPVLILLSMPSGAAKFVAWAVIAAVIALSTVGSAGLAAKMGEHLASRSDHISSFSAFIRGAVVLELASFFPILGWLFILPLTTLTSIGATGFALLHWMPKIAVQNGSRPSDVRA